jgi:hypothetical protein
MGRHSSPDQGPFLRSLAAFILFWVFIAGVLGAAAWLAVDLIGGDEVKGTPTAAESPTHRASPSPKASELVIATPTPDKSEPEPVESETPKPELITDGITVQVLNGTSDLDADDRMADKLASLGFTIEAIEGSSKSYPQTTVFWSYPESEDAARALAERFGWLVQPKPANLSDTVAVHVVVGADEV